MIYSNYLLYLIIINHLEYIIMALEITPKNYSDIINSDKLVVLDFWAPWCGPCKMIGPILEELASEYEGKAIIGKVNTEDEQNEGLVAEYAIRNLPTIFFMKNGKIVDKMVGAASKSDFQSKIQAWL